MQKEDQEEDSQVDPETAKRGRATVLFAFIDDDQKLAERTALSGLCMFGERAKVVISGNKPSLIQCGRCFSLNHRSNHCPLLPKGHFKCVRCLGPHHTYHHDGFCKAKTHKMAEVCDCKPKCLLCRQSGHDAVSRSCPMRGDFGPPKLVLPPDYAPEDVAPEPMQPADAPPRPGSPSILHSRVRARPAWKGKGKDTANVVDTSLPTIPLPAADPAYIAHLNMLRDMPPDDLRNYLRNNANDPTDEGEIDMLVEQTAAELCMFERDLAASPMHTDDADLPFTSLNPPL